MEMRETNKEEDTKDWDVPVPKRNFIKLVVKDFLTERNRRGELIFDFDLGERIPPPKPLGF